MAEGFPQEERLSPEELQELEQELRSRLEASHPELLQELLGDIEKHRLSEPDQESPEKLGA